MWAKDSVSGDVELLRRSLNNDDLHDDDLYHELDFLESDNEDFDSGERQVIKFDWD